MPKGLLGDDGIAMKATASKMRSYDGDFSKLGTFIPIDPQPRAPWPVAFPLNNSWKKFEDRGFPYVPGLRTLVLAKLVCNS
jgi:hypothetical protein